MKPALLLHAERAGLGDCLHGRGVVKELLNRYEVWMRTRWPQVWHDMPIRFDEPPADAKRMTLGYHPAVVLRYGSVLGAMGLACGVDAPESFALPIPEAWQRKALALIEEWRPTKPLLIVRPLLDTDGPDNPKAKRARNPDADAYSALLASLQQRFFTVAVATCVPDGEWLVGPQIAPDVDCTRGELDFETLAALFWMADLVFCPPGFATVLAQAVETPCVTVFGGYEDARSFSAGRSPWLAIEPLTPCPCWRDDCAGDKTIDLMAALGKLERFVGDLQ